MFDMRMATAQADEEGDFVTGPFTVNIPYLDIDQGEEVTARIDAGENLSVVLSEVIGVQNYPQRQFTVDFDLDHPLPADAGDLSGGDCHPIGLP